MEKPKLKQQRRKPLSIFPIFCQIFLTFFFAVSMYMILEDYRKPSHHNKNQYNLIEGKNFNPEQTYKNGITEGKRIGYKNGLIEGEKKGYQLGYEDGIIEGKKIGYENGFKRAKITQTIANISVGVLIGLLLSIGTTSYLTRSIWLKAMQSRLQQLRLMLMVGKSNTNLEPELYQQVINLGKHIHKVKNLLAQDSQLKDEKWKLEELNQKVIDLASLLQQKKNIIAGMKEPSVIIEEISNLEKKLAKFDTNENVKDELKKTMEEKSKKLAKIKTIKNQINCYEIKLANYHNFLDNFELSYQQWRINMAENEFSGVETEAEISYLTELFSQFEQEIQIKNNYL